MILPPDVQANGQRLLLGSNRGKIWRISSQIVTLSVFTMTKLMIQLGWKIDCKGIENLQSALDESRKQGRGLLTIANHISIVDDPILWVNLPWSQVFCHPQQMRWTLGAKDICFKNKIVSKFFSLGRTLPTERFGRGSFQPSLDGAIYALSNCNDNKSPEWVHIFPEAFVHQSDYTMRYFKWGVSRLVLEPTIQPIILPIFHYGLDSVFPENVRHGKIRLPRNIGSKLHFTFGNILPDDEFKNDRIEWSKLLNSNNNSNHNLYQRQDLLYGIDACNLRSSVAGKLRSHLVQLRNQMGFTKIEEPHFADPIYWRNNK